MPRPFRRPWILSGLVLVGVSGLLVGLTVAVQQVRDAASHLSDT